MYLSTPQCESADLSNLGTLVDVKEGANMGTDCKTSIEPSHEIPPMSRIELHRALCLVDALRRLPLGLLVVMLIFGMSIMTLADGPIASSSFVGVEDPLSENGAWVSLTAYSPYGTQFQKNNGAYADRLSPVNHAASRTTSVVPADQYSEIVVGHIEDDSNNVGPIVRVQTSGAASDSVYLWWASVINGVNYLYRLDANVPDSSRGTTYTATALTPTSPVVDGDVLRLIARGQVLYGLKNGVRDFIYNTATNTTTYSTGATGIMAYADGTVTNAVIASWSTGAAPVSSGTWASSTFAGTENPLDEGDRWYPLPGYAGFSKAGGQVIGLASGHNAEGVWSITPPATQYSEVTLGGVASGGGGPIVRIDRNNPGQTGWLLFLYADNPSSSGIYKMTPDANFTAVQLFTPTIIAGDKWRLTANGNTLEVFQNGVSQFTYTTDGSYATGDVGIEAYTPAFTFTGWDGGDAAGGTGQAPTINSVSPNTGSATGGTVLTITGTNFAAGAKVTLGNSVATSVTLVSDTTITATTPANAAGGRVDLTVSNTDGQSGTMSPGFIYMLPTPKVASVTPVSGPTTGGTAITINGTNFFAGATVSLGGKAATGVTVVNSTTIMATTNTHNSGAVGVTVTNVDGQSAFLANSFTYNASAPAPTVSSVSPNTGLTTGGTAVTITGTNFAAGATVTVGNIAATNVSLVSATTITATTPAHAAGAVSVSVTNLDAQIGTLASGFTYTAPPPPTLTSVTPNSGVRGTTVPVTLTGTNFTAATGTEDVDVAVTGTGITIGAITVVNSGTITTTFTITATTPIGARNVSVTTEGGTSNTQTFTVMGPSLTSISPNAGELGTSVPVTLTGSGLTGATAIAAGGGITVSNLAVVNDTTVTATFTIATTAGLTARNVTVTTTPGGTGNPVIFTVVVPPVPTLISATPNSGLRGTAVPVTLTGTDFTATGTRVAVSGTGVTVGAMTVLDSGTISTTFTITATAPITVRNVSVTTPGGTSNIVTFTVQGPSLTSISPNTGELGTSVPVTLTGSGLTGATAIAAGGGITVSNLTVMNDTTVTATFTIAAGAGLTARNVSLTTTPGGTSNPVIFTVIVPPVPTLISATPNSGLRGTALPVTLTGTDFTATGTRVAVSGTGVTVGAMTVLDSGTISTTFTITATAPITVRNVSVTTPGGISNTQTFTVLGPTLSSVTPNPVTHGTGVLLTITGTNLTGATAVAVSGTGNTCTVSASTSTTVNATCTLSIGSFTVTVTTPIGITGSVPLTVN
jgi:hypothetical protein